MAGPATLPARPRRAAGAADADAALSRALVRALGEFAAFARGAGRSRRRRGAQAAEERQAIVAWLRGRSAGELASLCSVEDGAFVKTVLSMAMAASRLAGRARKGAVQQGGGQVAEFQILPMTGPRGKLATRRRRAGETVQTPQTQAPREFVARPLVRTADGDVFGAFHTREYGDAVQKFSDALYFYNTHKSCDTVSLSLESLGVVLNDASGRSTGTNVDVLVALLSAISGGAFLYCAPSEATLSDRVWGETKWLSSQGYYSLEALVVNQIELNIWNHWYAAKASPNDAISITMTGPATKQYLVHEWNQSSTSDRCRVLQELHARVVDHLQGSCNSTPNRLFQSAKASLAHLVDLVSLDQDHEIMKSSLIVERLFGCQLKQIIAAPQVAALKFLVSEHLQARCSVLLSERIASEASALNQFTASTEREGECNRPENHSQRRRASRKKILKQRRQDSIVKTAQQQQLKLVHVELLAQYRRRREESVRIASGILNDLIGRAVDSAKGEGIYPSPSKLVLADGAASIAKKRKKSKKKTKKKKKSSEIISTTLDNDVLQGNEDKDLVEAGSSSAGSTPTSKENVSLEGNTSQRNPSKSETTGERTLVGTQRLQQQGLLYSSSSEPRPFLGFLSSVNVATSLTTFSPRPFYPTAPSTFFSPLAIRGRDAYPAGNQEGKMQHKVDDSERASSDVSSDSLGNDSLSISDQSSFDWRLPSMFSTPTAPDREQSTISPLDWNFYNYRWPLQSDVGGEGSSDSDQSAPNSDRGRGPISYSGREDESGSYPLRSFPTAPVVESGLGGGRTRTFSDADERGFSMKSNNYHDEDDELSPSDPIVTKSDFLYRKGGFFDRQRALKHRRQPHLDTNAAEPSPSGVQTSTAIASAANIETVYENDKDHSERPSRCHKCCSCDCHKGSSSDDTALSTDSTQQSAIESALRSELKETRSELSSIIERISKLEKDFIDQIAHAKTVAADAIKDVGSLQQTVSALSSQLQAAESEIRTLQSMYRPPVLGSSFNCDDQADVIMEGCGAASGLETSADSSVSSLGPSFSPAPSSDSHMSEGSVIARPNATAGTAGRMMDYNYPHSLVSHPTVAPSAMGPFVSVPMSVLPPRSKLHWDMCEFVSQLQSESNARLPAQMEAQRLCTATVQSLWPRAQVRPYGSYVTRLVLPSSDVDLVICLPKVRRDAPADTAGVLEGRNAIKETWQQNLARKLRQEPWVVPDSVKTLPHASIPIITLLTAPPYNVRLDISFEGPGHNGLATNDVVLSLIHEFPPLAPIMLVLKSFAIERGFAVAYSGGLSSYALLLMVARYLQEYNDTLPNGFENVSAAVQHSISAQSAADFGMMLMGFLDFYGNRFDPRTTGISVASRSFLNRETMAPSSSTSPSGSSAVPVQHSSRDGGSNSMEHWQNMPPPPPPPIDLLSSPGSRRYGYRSSLDWPQNPTSTGDMMNMMVRGEYYPANAHVDPHKFDPVFIEDPLRPSNNVGRNCFRIMQIRRAFAAAHNALALASRSSAVFSENRSAVIAGVVLHPDNLLRAVLGANAPVNIKSETAMPAVPSGNVGGPAPSPRQTPHSMRQNYLRFQHHVATSEGVPFGSPQPVATHYFGGEGGYPVVHPDQLHPATHLHHHYQQAYRFRGSNSVNHYRHQPHQTHHDDYMIDHASARGGNSYHHEYTSPHRLHEPTSRRYSESESERLTTRSVTSADQYERVQRRERSVGSPRRKTRSTAASQPRLGSVGGKPSTFEDHEPNVRHHKTDRGPQNIATRKSPARSLSFADVVVGGSGNARQRTSPLALARQGRFWRDDSAINDSISEKWETKDDSQLK